jgi:hypothetical protein
MVYTQFLIWRNGVRYDPRTTAQCFATSEMKPTFPVRRDKRSAAMAAAVAKRDGDGAYRVNLRYAHKAAAE